VKLSSLESGERMRVCIVHGSPRKGNTYRATLVFQEQLRQYGAVDFAEFHLPKDMPHFCLGCHGCFEKGEKHCPHAPNVQPIVKAMLDADGIILTSPVYVLAESGCMKAFLDHLGYMYIAHRPMEEMFSKVAMVISTAAGTGTRHSMGAMARSLNHWGVKRIYRYGLNVFAPSWDDMKPAKQRRIRRTLDSKAKRFYHAMAQRAELRPRVFTRAMFTMMRKMMFQYPDGHIDKEYWRQKGWLTGSRRAV